MEPVAQVVLEVAGNAEMEWVSKRLKIIDTLSYPGLAIKGIAAIGPTLDLYGQMKAKATISGQLRAGAKITFPKQLMYFPQVEEAKDYIKQPQATEGDESSSKGTDFVPILDAAVQASVNVDLLITPEVNLGIKVTAPKVSGDVLNAQIVGFVNNTFRFEVQADGKAGIGNTRAGSYHIYIKYIYNFGVGGIAKFKWLGEYALKPYYMWDAKNGRTKILYEHYGEVSLSKRNTFISEGGDAYIDKFEPLYNSSYQLDDEWYGSSGALSPSLGKRDQLADHAALGDKAKRFTCNDGGKCEQGGCSGDKCEWKPPASQRKLARADGDPEEGDPEDADPNAPCQNSVPAFMYNCKYFPDRDGGGGYQFKGICHNILDYMRDHEGGGLGPVDLTYNWEGKASGSNRNDVCGERISFERWDEKENKYVNVRDTWSKSCIAYSDRYWREMNQKASKNNGNGNWASCDEFPFNAVLEGGDPNRNARACVPGYQQTI
ncbi:hypothetical protein DPSP01_000523 [Paraphaeosphaeria sporulosa]